jgi:PAS domain S-box-containing protein
MNEDTVPDLYRLLTEQIADALIYAGPDGKIGEWNGAAETLFGYAKAEAIGQSLDLIIPERLRAAHWAAFDRAMALGATRLGGKAMLTRAQTRAGGAIYVEMSFAAVCDAAGKAVGAVAVARDATQRHHDDKALRERLAELERMNPGPSVAAD